MSDNDRAAALADEIDARRLVLSFAYDPYVIVRDADVVLARALRAYDPDQANDTEIGRSICAAVAIHQKDPSDPLYEWSPAERWDEVIGDLVEMVHEAREDRPAIGETWETLAGTRLIYSTVAYSNKNETDRND